MTVEVAIEPRRPHRQDTFDLRNDIHTDNSDSSIRYQHHQETIVIGSDEDHSMMDDDSSNEDRDGEYMEDDDGSSSLSIPNESIDFDLVYSLHNFAATVEGQASVVKGDSLFLMDDSNSYWWLVRVLTTQEVGYIPAENIETPFERLARLNKHRNVDLASATQEELQENVQTSRDRIRGIRAGNSGSPLNPLPHRKSVIFTNTSQVFNYPPALWGDVEEDDDGYEDYYQDEYDHNPSDEEILAGDPDIMEPDDGMSWEEGAVEQERTKILPGPLDPTAPEKPLSPLVSPLSPSPVANSPHSINHPAHLYPGDPAGAQSQPSTILNPPQYQPQQSQQQQPQQQTQPQQQQQQTGVSPILRSQSSRERLAVDVDALSPVSITVTTPTVASPLSSSPINRVLVDPAIPGDTRKISATPSIAREEARKAREEADDSLNRRSKPKDTPSDSSSLTLVKEKPSIDSIKSSSSSGGKLRKGRDSPALSSSQEEEGGKKEKEKEKKKTSMFGGLFGRKKDKKDKSSEGAVEHIRNSEDSMTTSESSSNRARISNESRRSNVSGLSNITNSTIAPSTPAPAHSPPVISRLRQDDLQQQALYHQYLKSSPSTSPEGPYHGLQPASIVMPNNNNANNNNNLATPGFRTQGGRPGSLIISPNGLDGHGPLPELSVIRVFAGENLHTEATFKTVLLNASTTAADLVKQAKQRFRLPAAENDADYFLEIKQIEGQSAILLPDQRPLGVFESLVEAAEMELPKVKRSSVGSISSVSSNLSLHPAIKKLSMNDFTDDSAVKFYLNRRSSNEDMNTLYNLNKEEDTMLRMSMDDEDGSATPLLTVTTASGTSVTPERFNSPSVRFAVQVYIFPDDLPDEMIFDPQTEAIVPKSSLRDRAPSATIPNSNVSQSQRRKILHFPKNTTVAEVIELALERFGIAEGVVDGGDEVEDKLAKRVSLARVRYGLAAMVDSQERQLHPSSKVIDAFARPPIFRSIDRRSGEKRRSADSAFLLNAAEDIRPDDPIFILRRAIGLRNTGKSKPTPLDDYALQKKHQSPHKDSVNVEQTVMSHSNTQGSGEENMNGHAHPPSKGAVSPTTLSRQELIAAQRLVSLEKQRAILSAQTNSERGVDVVLPGNAILRSTALDASSDKMRYSYVQDGEIYDISDIVEEERRAGKGKQVGYTQYSQQQKKDDWLEGVVRQEGLGDNLDRLLSRIKDSRAAVVAARAQAQEQQSRMLEQLVTGNGLSPAAMQSHRGSVSSAYSIDVQEVAGGSPTSPTMPSSLAQRQQQFSDVQSSSRTGTPAGANSTTGRTTPIRPPSAAKNNNDSPRNKKQPSTGSLHSDEGSNSTNEVMTPVSTASTPATTVTQHGGPSMASSRPTRNGPSLGGRRSPVVVKDDLEIANMITVIELNAGVNWGASSLRPQTPDYVDGLFGPTINLEELHPRIREMYAGTVKQLDDMDSQLDQALSLLYPHSARTPERSMIR